MRELLAPFWEWLFDTFGVFGLMVATAIPGVLIFLAVVVIVIVSKLLSAVKKKSHRAPVRTEPQKETPKAPAKNTPQAKAEPQKEAPKAPAKSTPPVKTVAKKETPQVPEKSIQPAKTTAVGVKVLPEIQVGEAFLWGKRPVVMLENGGGKVTNGRLVCVIADFLNGPPKAVYFPATLRFSMLNIPVSTVKAGSCDAKSGKRVFTDDRGNTFNFRPYLWAEKTLDLAEDDPEIRMAEYQGTYYVISIRKEGKSYLANRGELRCQKISSIVNDETKDLLLIENGLYCFVSDGYTTPEQRFIGQLDMMTKTDGFRKFTMRKWQDGKLCEMEIHFDDVFPTANPIDVTLQYVNNHDGKYFFMDPDDGEIYAFSQYELPVTPSDADAGDAYTLTIAFDHPIKMQKN